MKLQQGSTATGFIAGVVVGLAIALAVAVYITKVPVPFVRESPSRTADQDADETRKNKDWDPNAPLYGKNPARPASAASGVAAAASAAVAASGPVAGTKPAAASAATAPGKPSSDPLGDLARQKAGATVDGSAYFVQTGAFNSAQDAEAQRAKLALAGVEAQITEREQSGRSVYRVRSGPLDTKDEADKVKGRVEAAGFEAAIIKVQR